MTDTGGTVKILARTRYRLYLCLFLKDFYFVYEGTNIHNIPNSKYVTQKVAFVRKYTQQRQWTQESALEMQRTQEPSYRKCRNGIYFLALR